MTMTLEIPKALDEARRTATATAERLAAAEARHTELWQRAHSADAAVFGRAKADLPAADRERFLARAEQEEAARRLRVAESEDRDRRRARFEAEVRPAAEKLRQALERAAAASQVVAAIQARADAQGVQLSPIAWHEFSRELGGGESRLDVWMRICRDEGFMS